MGSRLSEPSIVGPSQLHRSYADTVKSKICAVEIQVIVLQRFNYPSMGVLFDQISAVEAKLALLRSHLRLERSFTEALFRPGLQDGKVVSVCRNCCQAVVNTNSPARKMTVQFASPIANDLRAK